MAPLLHLEIAHSTPHEWESHDARHRTHGQPDPVIITNRPLGIGYLSDFAPRKLGTGEGRVIAFAHEAARRGHAFTLFGREPLHSVVRASLQEAGAEWQPLASLEASPVAAGRRLAREFDVLQLNMIPPRSPAAIAAAVAVPARVLFVDRVSGLATGDHPRSLPFRLLDRLTMSRVHELAGITEYVRARAARRFGLPRHRTRVIHNGVDESRFHPPLLPRPSAPIEIACVANLIPEKGVEVLFRALAQLRGEWRVSVVGDGPERTALEGVADRVGISRRVRFLGLRDDVPELLRAAHILVHPAVWQEALGNTILEGMSSGCAVIASATGGIPELFRDGIEGFLVPPNDDAALAARLQRCADDPELRAHLGANARSRVLKDFTLARSIHRHLDWIEAAAR